MNRTSIAFSRGMTLVELMIALTIGLMLLAGAASMFITNKRIYQDIGDLGALQENGRFALETMMKDVRMSGYPGCNNDMALVNNRLETPGNAPTMLNFDYSLEGSEAGAAWAPSGNTGITSTSGNGGERDMVSGTDAIAVRYLAPVVIAGTTAKITGDITGSAAVPVTDADDFTVGELMAVSDCDAADIFQITNKSGNTLVHASFGSNDLPVVQDYDDDGTPSDADIAPNNADADLSDYSAGADLSRYIVRRYYVGLDQTASGLAPALFWQTPENYDAPQVLVEGVEDMQILYGKDTDADGVADSYMTAAAVGTADEWKKIVNVKLALLMRTPDVNGNLENDTDTYNLLGTVVGPYNDKRRRRIFKTTVQVRNQYLGK